MIYMLVNKNNAVNSNVEFVSYSGKYPCLCMGVLTLKIDGEEVKFGNKYSNKDVDYPTFWHSGGGIDSNYCAYSGEWEIDVEELPEQYRKYATEIDDVFNENVEHGCCGGCI